MKEVKSAYYVQVQRHKTVRYGPKQHYQDYVAIPLDISEALELQPRQILKCVLNGSSFTLARVAEKPVLKKISYEEWRDKVERVTPLSTVAWKSYAQIRIDAKIPIRTAPALWVKMAESDIGLRHVKHPKLHLVMWALVPKDSDAKPINTHPHHPNSERSHEQERNEF
jgi:hypothetical protein